MGKIRHIDVKCSCCECGKSMEKRALVSHLIQNHGLDFVSAFAKYLSVKCKFDKVPFFEYEKFLKAENQTDENKIDFGRISKYVRFYVEINRVRDFDFEKDYANFEGAYQFMISHPKISNSKEFAYSLFPTEPENAEKYYNLHLSKNPFQNHGGKLSPFSKDFVKYANMTDEEREAARLSRSKTARKTMTDNHNCSCRLDYYTSRGYSESEAKKMLRERQQTFTLEKCIKKYGEEEGRRIFNERQERWQNTLKSKNIDDTERIIKSRLAFKNGYSAMSQDFFWKLYDKIGNKYGKVRFATLDKNTGERVKENNEFMIQIDGRNFLVDFYAESSRSIIEFDGSYWHKDRKYDIERDNILMANGYRVLRISESFYDENCDKAILLCEDFLKKGSENENSV